MDHSEGETPSPVLPMTNVSYSRSTTETEPYVPTDAEDMLDVAISVLDPRLAHQASSSQSTPRSAGRYRQVHLSFASPPPDTRKRARCVQPPPTAEELEAQDNAIAEDAEVPLDTQIPDAKRSLARRFSTSWKQTYSWLSLKYNKQERQYGMKCSVCCKFAPNTKSPFGGAGVGARDFQKLACRNHDQFKVHLAAMEAERLAEGTEVRQRNLLNMLSNDPVMARVVKCMQGAHWIARNDAPIALFPMLVRFMVEQGCPDMVNGESYGRYYSRLSFDESTDRARGKHLIVYVTFERGEAVVSQFLALLSLDRCDAAALHDAIVKCLWSKDMSMDKLVGVSTDGAFVMTGSKNGVVAMLRKRCPWLVAIHCVAHREALAAKDAAKSFKEFNVVDQMIRQTAERLGRSSTDHKTYMHLQDIILQTHLEVQGFCTVRWLSRGDAVNRFCDVLPVIMWMWTKEKDETEKLATSFKFHYMLYLLADVLQLLNGLNLSFQKQTVDITEVKNHVDKVKTKLSQYYVEPGASNGPNTSRLNKFLAAHGSKDKRKLELKGVDENGKPAKAEIELHEDSIDLENLGGGCDLEACVDLARRFAQRLIKALGKRMADLRHFDGVGFFSPDKYPDRAGEQDAWVELHLTELLDMFKNQLPGVALADIEPQMRLFTTTMEKKFKKQSFHQALTNMLRAADWRDDYPTIVSLWRAVSVLPLSTVECERGFSRENIIKSWDRVALTDVRLGELMTVKMLDYLVDWAAAYALFEEKGRKGRKPAK
ncbi:unnamed protein product [Closterium sp. NIES-54]